PHPSSFCFSNHPPPTSIYTLSLHDALPIFLQGGHRKLCRDRTVRRPGQRYVFIYGFLADDDAGSVHGTVPRKPLQTLRHVDQVLDRKSTRLNSSHVSISYAVFCLKKKKNNT